MYLRSEFLQNSDLGLSFSIHPDLSTMVYRIFRTRYCLLFSFIFVFIFLSFLVRSTLLIQALQKTTFTGTGILRIYLMGLDYDIGVALLLLSLYNLYLLLMPQRFTGSNTDRILTYLGCFIALLITCFTFFAEITFWQEFESRFNFIAVDYLIYTYEVLNNINESYPLPLLISGVVLLVILIMFVFKKLGVLSATLNRGLPFRNRLVLFSLLAAVTISYPLLLSNSDAESSDNRYENELSKSGIYAFFAAFKNNELSYPEFYAMMPAELAYKRIRETLQTAHTTFLDKGPSIRRYIRNPGIPHKPNVIMITVESLSVDFLAHFGNQQALTPALDSLAEQGLLFSNMYATGTRTVRGMEALSLSIPPTPGSSIVRRPGNQQLATVGHIFEQAGYSRTFYYGGDGYFDNMNEFFGSNGFDIVDYGRNLKISDSYKTHRTVIPKGKVHFSNAWGICDEDLLDAVSTAADAQYRLGHPFYSFVMTTSNHRPFTFPSGKIDLQPGTREAAVKYTDYAIATFLKKARQKPWYKNTVLIIVADHCASSAGKNEVDVSKYHIPCIVLNLPAHKPMVIDKLCSQIDLYPTLFSLLGWKYVSKLYGQDVLDPGYTPRALFGTYQKLAYLRHDSLVILSPQRKIESFVVDKANAQSAVANSTDLVTTTQAYYQTAYELFKSGRLHQ